jgi:serine/threonine protein kinase
MIFLPEELVANRDTFERIRRETRVAVRLDHFNVITVLGLAKMEDGYARIVEYADAESMRSVLKRVHEIVWAIPPAVAATILADACAGVHYAHEMGLSELGRPLLHMAIRPETLLVTFKGVGMVTGYGAAAIAEGVRRAQGLDASIRDPYTAPEQAYGGRKAATVQTDVFALGSVLFEALTGSLPIESLPTKTGSEELEAVRSRLAGVPRPLADVVLRALARQSRERFASANELREALLDQPEIATKREVAAFMEELFPPGMPQNKARRMLLQRGQHEHDTQPPDPDGGVSSATASATVWRYQIDDEATPTDLPAAPAPQPPVAPKPVPQAAPAPRPPVASPAQPVRAVAFPPAPPPPVRTRRMHPAVYVCFALIVVLAFVFGILFTGVLNEEPPVPQVVRLEPLVEKPVQPAVADKKPAQPAVADKKPGSSPAVASTRSEVPPGEKKKEQVSRKKRRRTRRVKNRDKNRDKNRELLVPTTVGRSSTGSLTIEAPPGSKVYIQGKLRGVTPLKKIKLPAGSHKVLVVEKDAVNEYTHIVFVKPGQDLTLTVDFY